MHGLERAQVWMAVEEGEVSSRMAKRLISRLAEGDERPIGTIVRDVCGGGQLTDGTHLQARRSTNANNSSIKLVLLRARQH